MASPRRATRQLVTLIGPGGGGKTRLRSAARTASPSPAVCLVELAALTTRRSPEAVAAAIGVGLSPAGPARDLAGYLAHRGLLVLDNAEHVIEPLPASSPACSGRGRELPCSPPAARRWGSGEGVYGVPSLPIADAVRLFVERAGRGGAVIGRPTPTWWPRVRQLDGIPLAIELGRPTGSLTVRQIADRLDERFLLSRGHRPRSSAPDAAPVVEWSYELLDRRSGWSSTGCRYGRPFGPDAAAAVCAEPFPGQGPSCPARPARRRVARDREGDRYTLLETLRQYGAARLAERGEAGPVRDRHAATTSRWSGAVAAALHGRVGLGPGRPRGRAGPVRAALQWCSPRTATRNGSARPSPPTSDGRGTCGARWRGRSGYGPHRVTEHDRDRVRVLALYGAAVVSLGRRRHRQRVRLLQPHRRAGRHCGRCGPTPLAAWPRRCGPRATSTKRSRYERQAVTPFRRGRVAHLRAQHRRSWPDPSRPRRGRRGWSPARRGADHEPPRASG